MSLIDRLGAPYWRFLRRIYAGGRPNETARRLNRSAARSFAAGRRRRRDVTLEVIGRSSGRPIILPLVMADHDGRWYLVSMLGNDANWVRNVHAAGGRAVIRRKTAREVVLRDVPAPERAPIIRRYLEVAPGGRPHIPVDRTAPLAEFEAIAADHPVFRIEDIENTENTEATGQV